MNLSQYEKREQYQEDGKIIMQSENRRHVKNKKTRTRKKSIPNNKYIKTKLLKNYLNKFHIKSFNKQK